MKTENVVGTPIEISRSEPKPVKVHTDRVGFCRDVKIKLLRKGASVPEYATDGSACFDLCACIDHDVEVPAHGKATVGTGLAFSLEKGNVLLVFSRSGHGFKYGLRLVNCVGVIDSDYRGEVMVGIRNDSDSPYTIKNGERVAQAIVQSYIPCRFDVVDELDATERGAGGFGSTGK